MKRAIVIILLVFLSCTFTRGQKYVNPSYRFYANPGFVNISEISYGEGLIVSDLDVTNPNRYLGITNVFGYQANRNFFGGVGLGYFHYDKGDLIPFYLEYKYSVYLKLLTPYFFADGGMIISPVNFKDETKIFINPGIGISRYFSPKIEGTLSAGFSIQSRSTITSIGLINIKLGIIYRKNPYRMLKAKNNKYYY